MSNNVKKISKIVAQSLLGGILLAAIGVGILLSGCIKTRVAAKATNTTEGDQSAIKIEGKMGLMIEELRKDINKNIKTEINGAVEKIYQENNSGMFSGGAPYLVIIIVLYLYWNKRRETKDKDKTIAEKETHITNLAEQVKTLGTNGKKGRRTEAITQALEAHDEKEREQG